MKPALECLSSLHIVAAILPRVNSPCHSSKPTIISYACYCICPGSTAGLNKHFVLYKDGEGSLVFWVKLRDAAIKEDFRKGYDRVRDCV